MKKVYKTLLLLIVCCFTINSYAQFDTFYDDHYDQFKRDYTFKTEKEMDDHFKNIVADGYMMGYTKTYTNITNNKKDVMYILGAGEQDSFYLFYYNEDDREYLLVTTAFHKEFYMSPRYKTITYTQRSCCGEGVLLGHVTLQLSEKGAAPIENYATVDLNIPESDIQVQELFGVFKCGLIQNDNYNLRIYPSVENKYPDSDNFYNYFSDNLLGKIKQNTRVKVIGQRDTENRTWYYVEVNPKNLPINLTEGITHNKSQNIRGWVSSNFITLLP